MTKQRPTTASARSKALYRRKAPWLILCPLLLLAALLYYLQHSAAMSETDLIVPLELLHVKEGLTTTTPLGSNVEIRMSGSETALKKLKRQAIAYELDLSGSDVGVASFPVDRACIQLPKRVSILSIQPAFLTVRIEHEIKKEAPVVVTLSGKPAPGFYIDHALKKPPVIMLRGPRSVIEPIEEIRTKPFDVDGVSESIKKEMALDLPAGVTAMAPSELILVELMLKEKEGSRVFEHIPVTGKEASFDYSITPPEIRIEIEGPVTILDKLQDTDGLKAHVELSGLEPGVYARRAVIQLPVSVRLIDASPEIFTIRLTRSQNQ